VVLFQSAVRLRRLLQGLRTLDYPRDRVALRLFDNSPDDGAEGVLRSIPLPFASEYVPSSAGNIGFGAGHNRLAARSGETDYLLLLNPDTIPFRDCVRRLVTRARAAKRAGLIEAAQFPVEHPKEFDLRSGETNWCSAACLLTPTRVFSAIGGFDENIFLYSEDVDLSWKAWTAGWTCVYEPTARCVHVTADHDPGKDRAPEQFHLHVSNLYVRAKWFGSEAVDHYLGDLRRLVDPEKLDAIVAAFRSLPPQDPPLRRHRRLTSQHNYGELRWSS
jgi:GT2 family glycosyltransferase